MTVLELVGGGFDGLVQAVEEVRRGRQVVYVEPSLRAGGALRTESFLSPFRFNLGPTLVPRPPLPSLETLEPDELLEIDGTVITRAMLLDGDLEPEVRELWRLFAGDARIDDLVLVPGGNGLAAACLVDEIVAAGSRVVEGVGGVDGAVPAGEGLGVCRLFVGLRGPAPEQKALARYVAEPRGFVVSNAHLDLDPDLSSFVWQGLLPFGSRVQRDEYAASVLAAVGVDPADVVFRLLWLPEDTRELAGG